MKRNLVIQLKDAITGSMLGGRGTFRIFIDQEVCGAQRFSLLMNTLQKGTQTTSHQHQEESCFYILSGRGTIAIGDNSFDVSAQTAVFVPPKTMHKIDAYPEEDLTYIMVYAPPGPEQPLKSKGEYDFSSGRI